MHIRFALALLLLAACGGRTYYVTIRHPLEVGAVDPNQVMFDQSREENQRQLPPGALLDQAELVSLTPEQICVRVTIWSDQLEPQRSDYNSYRIALLNDQGGVENTTAQIQMMPPSMNAFQGVRRQARFTGGVTVVRAYAQPFVWQITQNPAQLCFQNGGFVTPATTRLVLEMGNAGAGNRMNFEWQLASSVAQ
jgi:hypothetical protein